MFGKIKKVFFTGVFGVLYISYIAQFVFVLTHFRANQIEAIMACLVLLSVEWLVLIAARYLSKRSSNNVQSGHSNGFRRH